MPQDLQTGPGPERPVFLQIGKDVSASISFQAKRRPWIVANEAPLLSVHHDEVPQLPSLGVGEHVAAAFEVGVSLGDQARNVGGDLARSLLLEGDVPAPAAGGRLGVRAAEW